MDKVIKLENVNQYNELYGLETLHPLISVIDLTKATKTVNHIQMNYGLYALFLKNRHKAQRKAKFYINKCRSASCMQGGLKQASA